MDLAKSQIFAAAASLSSHEAQLASCQQHLTRLHEEAQAADEVADLVLQHDCHNIQPNNTFLQLLMPSHLLPLLHGMSQ